MNSAISFLSVIHNEKMSSMNLFHARGLVLLRFSISVSTADTKVTPSDLPSYFELKSTKKAFTVFSKLSAFLFFLFARKPRFYGLCRT